MSYVFISYSHADEDYALALEASLRQHEIGVWRDSTIDYGSEWPDVIEDHLDRSTAVVLIMSVNSKKSRWVKNELTRAQRKGIPLFPVLLSGETWLPLETTQYIDARDRSLPTADFLALLREETGGLSRGEVGEPSFPPVDAAAARDAINPANGLGDQRTALARRIEDEMRNLRVGWDNQAKNQVVTRGTTIRARGTTINKGFILLKRYRAQALDVDEIEDGRLEIRGDRLEQAGWHHGFWPRFAKTKPASRIAKKVADLHIDTWGDDPGAVIVETTSPSVLTD